MGRPSLRFCRTTTTMATKLHYRRWPGHTDTDTDTDTYTYRETETRMCSVAHFGLEWLWPRLICMVDSSFIFRGAIVNCQNNFLASTQNCIRRQMEMEVVGSSPLESQLSTGDEWPKKLKEPPTAAGNDCGQSRVKTQRLLRPASWVLGPPFAEHAHKNIPIFRGAKQSQNHLTAISAQRRSLEIIF